MIIRKWQQFDSARCRTGFTLVEMLVATALTVLIMLLFAQIYGTALGTMSAQRGIGNNDQKARVNINMIRRDLEAMTYRQPMTTSNDVRGIVAMGAGDGPLIDSVQQRGYFYYSENDVGVDWDDVLQFTVELGMDAHGEILADDDVLPFFGRAQNIQYNDTGLGAVVSLPNQPVRDDGFPTNGQSRTINAEISYFLRGGNLYRRILLIRKPLDGDTEVDPQPSTRFNTQFYTMARPNYVDANGVRRVFWEDFDFSATRQFIDPTDTDGNGITSHLWFNSDESLSNDAGSANQPLAFPWNRFGHLNDQRDLDIDGNLDNPHHGMPREYLNASGSAPPLNYFLGRLTHAETSSPAARFPGTEVAQSASLQDYYSHYGMFSRTNTVMDTSGGGQIPTTGIFSYSTATNSITELAGSTRLGEDIIGTNIDAFDVKVWDSKAGRYVDLGYAVTPSSTQLSSNPLVPSFDFDHQRNQNPYYGPRIVSRGSEYGAAGDDDGIFGAENVPGRIWPGELGWPGTDDVINRVFDTWHPSVGLGTGVPPFQPLKAPPNYISGFARGTQWAPNWEYALGTIHYPMAGHDQNGNGAPDDASEDMDGDGRLDPGEDANGNGQLDPFERTEDINGNGTLDPGEDSNGNLILDVPDQTPRSYAIGYRVIRSGISGTKRPSFPLTPGSIITELGPQPATDINGSGTIGDDPRERGVIWECFDNRVGLTAIQITLRYKDIQTGLPRQVTIEHSFVE